jgi:FKBP-type peptidyl-prolyl cis-trans isomerase (trigger factor)
MTYTIIKKTDLPRSQVEIEASASAEDLAKYRDEAIKHLGQHAQIDGFRKGHIPANILIQKFGEFSILEEAGSMAIEDIVPEIIITEKIDALGRPEVSITKIALGNPMEFKLKISIMPSLELPDYKKIAAKENAIKEEVLVVTEKEVDEALENIRKAMAPKIPPTNDGVATEPIPALPEINDEFAKSLGNFKDLTELKAKINENMLAEKSQKAKEKKRLQIAEKIIAGAKTEIPEILIQGELSKMDAQFEEDIAKMGLKTEDYLTHLKKTREDLRKEWEPDAEKRAKLQLILNRIATEEKIEADQKAVDEQAGHLIAHYTGADPERAKIYVATMMTNEKVFEFLDGIK